MAQAHDGSYKLFFSYPNMVADLLRGFVHELDVEELDFTSLEKVNASYVSDDLHQRSEDVVWRLRWRGRTLYVYLLLEFQSSDDRLMALRAGTYRLLFYQDLVKRHPLPANGKLPPVLVLVLYNGAAPWRAHLDLGDLVESVPGLEDFHPTLRYLAIDERRAASEVSTSERNLVATLFRLEAHRSVDEVRELTAHLVEWLDKPEHVDLQRTFAMWLTQVVMPARLPGIEVPEVENLKEFQLMLNQEIPTWTEQWMQEGVTQGEAKTLLRILARKFGVISDPVKAQIAAADDEQLLHWAEEASVADTLEQVFA